MRIFMRPSAERVRNSAGGIPRVVEAYTRGLAERGHTFVRSEDAADLVVVHAGEKAKRQPDVACCHGLYPTALAGFGGWGQGMNAAVIENVRTAKLTTVPSSWVALLFERDMHFSPAVVPHGIWTSEYKPAGSVRGPIVWPKTRVDAVCDPAAVIEMAGEMPERQFWSVGKPNEHPFNLTATGPMPYNAYLSKLRECSLYLATTKETGRCFGVMEALAMGIPVVGYALGATGEFFSGAGGCTLVAPGDVKALVEVAYRVLSGWKAYHEAAIEFSRSLDWRGVMGRVEALWTKAATPEPQQPLVSIVIPCHNYARFLPDAIRSALAQDYPNVEVIVVDDASTDDTRAVIKSFGERVRRVLLDKNEGVARARNAGLDAAKGVYAACLDSDDTMYPWFVSQLLPALTGDRGAGLAYGGIDTMNESGQTTPTSWFNGGYDYEKIRRGVNYVPSCCLFRREAWRRTGGYRKEYITGEDGDLWVRISALGWRVVPVPGKSVYRYRRHGSSLSVNAPKDDWYTDKAWWTDNYFAAGGYVTKCRSVRNYDEPVVSIIVTIQPGQERLIPMLLDSLEAQDEPNWEAWFVDKSGSDPSVWFRGAPFVRRVTDDSELRPKAKRRLLLRPDEYLTVGALRAALACGGDAIDSEWPCGKGNN